MRLWRPDYQSIMKKISKDDSGITLVELLAVLALMSVVILLGGAVHMFGQRQFQAQTESASQNNDLSYAMTVMSSDLRKIPLEDADKRIRLNFEGNLIEIFNTDLNSNEATIETFYTYEDNELSRNGEVLIKNLKTKPNIQFMNNDRVEITFDQKNKEAGIINKNYNTTIYFRGEPTSDEKEIN